MSLKMQERMFLRKKMGHWKPFADIWSWMKKSEATIRKYMHDVKVFLTFQKGKGSFRKEQIIGYKNWLGERYAVRSANSMLTAVNQFLKFVGAGECCVKLFKLQYQTFVTRERSWGGRNIGAFGDSPAEKTDPSVLPDLDAVRYWDPDQ